MNKLKIIVADGQYLSRCGLASLVQAEATLELACTESQLNRLNASILLYQPQVVILDYNTLACNAEDIATLKQTHPTVHFLGITNRIGSSIMLQAVKAGLTGHLLKDCDQEEIIEAIHQVAKGETFLCGQIVLLADAETESTVNCTGINISEREIEIIALIAEGLSNKEVAERLFLSAHTVTTHRKNIMHKLNINNTAGLVLFAVKHNLVNSNNKYLFSETN